MAAASNAHRSFSAKFYACCFEGVREGQGSLDANGKALCCFAHTYSEGVCWGQLSLNATLDANLAAAQAALATSTGALNATVTQLAATVAADQANVALLTQQLTQARHRRPPVLRMFFSLLAIEWIIVVKALWPSHPSLCHPPLGPL